MYHNYVIFSIPYIVALGDLPVIVIVRGPLLDCGNAIRGYSLSLQVHISF